MEKSISKFKTKEFINMFNHLFLKFNILFNELKQKKKSIEVFTKEDNEKFTNFDWCFQKIIENYLDKYFSSMKFIGEENTKEVKVKNEFSEFLSSVDKITFNPVDKLSIDESVVYDEKDLCIYCDPIDGTSSFIKGKYSNVTVLVGVTYKKQPVLGLIHFLSYLDKEPRTFFNIPGNGIYSLTTNTEQLFAMKDFNDYDKLEYQLEKQVIEKKEKMNFIITASRENDTMSKSKIKKLLYYSLLLVMSFFPDPQVMRISGLGNKAIISILEDYFYFAPSKGLGYWDVCAAHALTKEAGGGCYFVNKDGDEVTYPENYEEKYFEQCFCLSADKSKVAKFLDIVNKEKIVI